MIVGVGPGEVSDAVAGRVAGLGAGGVVTRPGLFGRLGGPARVTVVSAPPGSGKTVLLRSWISQAGLGDCAAWVATGREERDPQRFWLSVLSALRLTAPGSALVQALTAAPDLDGWAVTERLLADLAPLADRLWLVIDDVHELGPDALRQLELLVMRAPPGLRFVLATRHDVRLGLHRLRLEGELAEIREPDLRFTVAEAGELFDAAGLELPEPAVMMLQERTEGWAAGLRLAALSLAGHLDPARFAAEFSGSERTVAEYLLAEVLDRQREPVRRLLLRTSVLERVNGELADLLTGSSGGERILQDLEEANAFVVALDAARSWFRYHRLFADLLALELRRTAPGEVAGLHRVAAGWFAGHGFGVEAIRHAQAARDWALAAGLLADHWPGLYLDGQAATTHELLAGFPAEARAADAELAALAAADELAQGSLEAAERYLGLAERGSASVPADRRVQAGRAARDRPAAAGPPARKPAGGGRGGAAAAGDGRGAGGGAARPGRGPAGAGADQPRHRRVRGGPVRGGSSGTWNRAWRWRAGSGGHISSSPAWRTRRRSDSGRLRGRQSTAGEAVELAERHGWTDEPAVGIAYMTLAAVLTWQGRPEEAEPWVQRAERTVRAEAEPAAALAVHYTRGLLELARGRDADALAAFRAAERLAGRLAAPHVPRHADAGIAAARPGAPGRHRARRGRPWPACVTRTATAARSASPRRRCGWPRTTRARRPPRWRRSWTAPLPQSGRAGWLALSCWRRSRGTHSATGPPPGARSSVPSISPSPTASSCRGSSSTVRRGCWSATPGTAPDTRPWSRRSSPCFHHWSQAPRNRPPMGIRGPKRYWEAGSPPVAKSGLGEIVPPG